MITSRREFGLAPVLLTASVPTLYPSMSLQSQSRSAVVSIKAQGHAFVTGKRRIKHRNPPSDTMLTLHGLVRPRGDGTLKLEHLGGSLQIEPLYYAITSGNGEATERGKIEINAKARGTEKALELILNGNTDGDAIVFKRKGSRLSSLHSLSLRGEAFVTIPAASTKRNEGDKNR